MNNQLDGEGGREGLAGLASTSQHRGNNLSSNSLPCILQTNNDIPPSAQEQNRAHAQIPLPQHFIVRPSVTKHTASGTVTIPGPIVPLVAVDQLPEWFELSGVPRELNLEQTVGLTNLGTAIRDPEFYTVRMRSDPETTSVMSSDNIAMVTPTSRERRPRQMDQMQQTQVQTPQQQQRHGITVEDRDNGSLIPVDMSATPLLGSYMDPAAMSFTDGGHNSALNSRARGSGGGVQAPNNNTDIRTERQKTGSNNNSPHQQLPSTANITLGIRPRLPSPTAIGSTPPGSSNPYPILHHYPHPQHHHDLQPPYPLAPPPSPQHPADRMLQSWYQPLHPSSHHHKPTSSAPTARQKSNPSGPTSSSGGGGGERPSIYCRHWCHRGTCRWGTACRYAHAMPATHEGLREVGLAHHPAWWTAAMNIGLAYGSGGFGGGPGFGLGLGGAWYPPRHYGLGGGSRKAQKDREREKERELKEKGSREKESAGGKGKGVVVEDKNGGGGAVLDIRSKKKDTAAAAEAKIGGAVGDQKQKKVEQPQKEQKLVEMYTQPPRDTVGP